MSIAYIVMQYPIYPISKHTNSYCVTYLIFFSIFTHFIWYFQTTPKTDGGIVTYMWNQMLNVYLYHGNC